MATMEHTLTAVAEATPMLVVSETASSRLLAMMDEKQLEGYSLRVFVSGGGCSGMQYGMTFDDEVREGDSQFDASGLRVLVDPISANYLLGASIDYVDSLMGGGFKIENPNAVSSCGCGHSFRTANDGGEASSGGGCGSCSG
ncbi:iron-sulfur cluster insertion protein ErpA [Candidatus Chloroploca sp. Khr17]|uniref:iron-sulfur cluster insertion protein ErpA n=1 Tax=Candidatus Chloroploca sp. Khr17 TaxID=2496869 RepID=UPI00101E039C|nr:iron-sulfur cluster insertion protein ErpA [Candidatus Chloroploca sp. Khr17]